MAILPTLPNLLLGLVMATVLAQPSSSQESCSPLTLDLLNSEKLVAMAIGVNTTDDAQVTVEDFRILCEGEVVSECSGHALLLVVEYRCEGVWCGEEGGGRGVELVQACCASPPHYNATTLYNTKGTCLGNQSNSQSTVIGLATGLTLLSMLTLLLGMALGIVTYHCYHAHKHPKEAEPAKSPTHCKQEMMESGNYLTMRSVNTYAFKQTNIKEETIYDLPDTGQISTPTVETVSMVDPTHTTSTVNLLEAGEDQGLASENDSDSSDDSQEVGVLMYANVKQRQESVKEKRLPITPPKFLQRILKQTASCDDLNVYDDAIHVKSKTTFSLDQGMDQTGGLPEQREGVESGTGEVQGYVGVVPPTGSKIAGAPPDDRLYEDISQVSITKEKVPQKYDYVASRFNAKVVEPRKSQTTPSQGQSAPPKARTLPGHNSSDNSNPPNVATKPRLKPRLPEKPKHNSLPRNITPSQREGKGGRGIGEKGRSLGQIGLSKRGSENKTSKDTGSPLTPMKEIELKSSKDTSSPLASNEPEDEYVESDIMRVKSQDGYVIQESGGYVVTDYKKAGEESQEVPLYEEMDKIASAQATQQLPS